MQNPLPGPPPTASPRVLTYERLVVRPGRLLYRYSAAGQAYYQAIESSAIHFEALPPPVQRAAWQVAAHVGVALAPRLFSLADFDRVHVEAVRMSDEAVSAYETLFGPGMAEFRLRNDLDPGKRVAVTCPPGPASRPVQGLGLTPAAVLLNGGGKDTVVAAEALKAAGVPFRWAAFHPTPAMERVARVSGTPGMESFRQVGQTRRIAEGGPVYSGFRPLGSLLAPLGVLAALTARSRYVVTGNEASADVPNFLVDGLAVNHQYAKSSAFELAFGSWVHAEVSEELDFFSVLRPLTELQVTCLAAGYRDYFGAFVSCNVGHRRDFWCGACPKCAFVFLALAAFLDRDDLMSIFGQDLFGSPPVMTWIRRMVLDRIRPFECVGTPEESRLALRLTIDRHPQLRDMFGGWEAALAGQPAPGASSGGFDGPAAALRSLHDGDRIPSELRPAILRYFHQGLGQEVGGHAA